MHKLAFSIKKYNTETKKSDFYNDINKIFSQKILHRIDNFLIDLELENEMKIDAGLKKFHEIYGKKVVL